MFNISLRLFFLKLYICSKHFIYAEVAFFPPSPLPPPSFFLLCSWTPPPNVVEPTVLPLLNFEWTMSEFSYFLFDLFSCIFVEFVFFVKTTQHRRWPTWVLIEIFGYSIFCILRLLVLNVEMRMIYLVFLFSVCMKVEKSWRKQRLMKMNKNKSLNERGDSK